MSSFESLRCRHLSSGSDMRRREFITLLGGATAAWPLTALAQQPTMAVIGFLAPGSAESDAYRVIAFRQGLNESGYVEGQNFRIEYRWAEGHYDRLPAMATELVHLQVAMIAATSASRARGKGGDHDHPDRL